ncbi:MAG: hypothetical protein ACXVAL_01745 [Vulcanimicrobiaceae bacterium]
MFGIGSPTLSKAAALAAVLLSGGIALAAEVPAGTGQVIFNDVPIAPASYPNYEPSHFALRGGPNARPQAFNYGNAAVPNALLVWYAGRLPQLGWHVSQTRRNYPVRGADSVIADRRGEAVTIVIERSASGSKVSIIKLVSTQ